MKRLLLFMLLPLSASGQTVPNINNVIFVDGSVNCLTSTPYPCTGAGVAAAAAAAGNGGTVYLPNKAINIASPGLNLTHLTNVTFVGTSAYASAPGRSSLTGTVLQFNYTGASTVGIDISGSIYLNFKNIIFSCGTSAANAPTVCFLHGRTSGSNGILNKLEDCMVVGYSPWIYYNYRGEQFSSMDTGYVEYGTSGVPITISEVNTAGITSPFVTLGGAASQSILKFVGGKTMVISNATTVTSPDNFLIYLDEGSGIIQSFSYEGYIQEAGKNNIIAGDTAGASGALENVQLNLQVDMASNTSHKLIAINGTAREWLVSGKVNPIDNTGGPALSFNSLLQSILKISTNIQNTVSGTLCTGSIIDVDQFGTVSCPFAAMIAGSNPAGQGISLTGVAFPFGTVSAPYTLSRRDFWLNVTGTTTITIPHAITGQRWEVFNSGAGTVTLAPDSGNICMAGSCAATKTLAVDTGVSITCGGTNCFAH
jgi:hypothetical protein